jgi:hypothetical protein
MALHTSYALVEGHAADVMRVREVAVNLGSAQ